MTQRSRELLVPTSRIVHELDRLERVVRVGYFLPLGFLVFASAAIPYLIRMSLPSASSLGSIPSAAAPTIRQPSAMLVFGAGRDGRGGVGRSRS
jgi:hypothetical protein